MAIQESGTDIEMCRYTELGIKAQGGSLEAKIKMLKKELKYRTIAHF